MDPLIVSLEVSTTIWTWSTTAVDEIEVEDPMEVDAGVEEGAKAGSEKVQMTLDGEVDVLFKTKKKSSDLMKAKEGEFEGQFGAQLMRGGDGSLSYTGTLVQLDRNTFFGNVHVLEVSHQGCWKVAYVRNVRRMLKSIKNTDPSYPAHMHWKEHEREGRKKGVSITEEEVKSLFEEGLTSELKKADLLRYCNEKGIQYRWRVVFSING